MKNQTIESFKVIGITVRTTNENGQSSIDIPLLWGKFMSEGIIEKISDKIDTTIYCIYTDYEKDHTKPYTTLLGCKVHSLDNLPTGFIGKTFNGGSYAKITARGNINRGMVFDEWMKIWNSGIPRAFTADFEVYNERAQNPEDAEVDIFVAIQ